MKNKFQKLLITFLLITFVCLPATVLAQDPPPQTSGPSFLDRLVRVGTSAYGYEEPAPPTYIAVVVINAFLSLLGAIFIILIIMAGFQWMTSAGNDEKIKHAQDRLKSAVIGLVIILISLAIVNFVIVQLVNINDLYT